MPITPGIWVAETSEYRPDRYYRYNELTELLNAWVYANGDIASIESIGKSYEGRDIWALTITDHATGAPEDKPAFFVDANIHAGEVSGCATILWMLNYIFEHKTSDPKIEKILKETTLYVVPAISVDGMDMLLRGDIERLRSSVRPFPTDKQEPGLVTGDVDGNGLILQMRIKDPAGPWKASALDPRIMTRRLPDDIEGEFYFILPEGTVPDWDGGAVNLAPMLRGLDANRNFPDEWGPHWQQPGAGDYPLSEPETRALADFIIAHKNIHGTQHFHTYSAVILRPPTRVPTTDLPMLDQEIFKMIGKMGTEETGYPTIGIYDDFAYDKKKPMKGGLIDWAYEQVGVIPFATELWSLTKKAGIEVKDHIAFFRDRGDDVDVKMLQLLDAEVGGEGFQDWTPFTHEQFGEVEIGGWLHMYTWQNPAGPWMEDMTSSNAKFLFRQMLTAPQLEFREANAESLGGDLYRVTALVQNNGFLPTYITEQARKVGVGRPVKIEIAGEGIEVVTGEAESDLGHLSGRVNQYGGMFFGGGYPIDSRALKEWIVKAPSGGAVTITAGTPKAGKITTEVALKV
jgi:murein tripeptide amidase MpaA